LCASRLIRQFREAHHGPGNRERRVQTDRNPAGAPQLLGLYEDRRGVDGTWWRGLGLADRLSFAHVLAVLEATARFRRDRSRRRRHCRRGARDNRECQQHDRPVPGRGPYRHSRRRAEWDVQGGWGVRERHGTGIGFGRRGRSGREFRRRGRHRSGIGFEHQRQVEDQEKGRCVVVEISGRVERRVNCQFEQWVVDYDFRQ
jgi:hypothetical protein